MTLSITSYGIVPFCQEQGEWKVLVVLHKEGNHWGFPKGKATGAQESPQAAAIRELKEETGLDLLGFLSTMPLVEEYQFRSRKGVVVKTVHYFPALVGGVLSLQAEEIRDAKWLTLEEALGCLSFEEARRVLRECFCLL